jgi:hypothetical protein
VDNERAFFERLRDRLRDTQPAFLGHVRDIQPALRTTFRGTGRDKVGF